MSMPSAARAAFRKLHESGCFVIPNPWDAGTARYLRRLGFKALATTSSGFSFSKALPDMDWAVPVDMALGHIAEIVAATELPVNADFESGYAHDAGRGRRQREALRRDRRRRAVDRGRERRQGQAALRSGLRGRAHRGSEGRDRCQRRRRAPDRPRRVLPGRPPGPAPGLDPPADGLRRGRRRRALRPWPAQARRHPGDRRRRPGRSR